ncbi:carboxymuconolactone decarboxylase family protein [Marinovum sp.]|uniref:carboxymuconolactone decarboxylase family protein n=1 Tax=Marinovum sp. TaxID=2024839 RepID=UPI003A8DA3E9
MTAAFPLPPISDADWPEEIAEMTGGFAGKLNVYRTMAHDPALLRAWATLRDHVVLKSALGLEMVEVVILRTGVRLSSRYEWQQHISRARKVGFTDARIASIRGQIDGMAPEDALLARAVDELFDMKQLSPMTAKALVEAYGKEGMIDVMATVGFYSTLGFLLKTCGTPLDDDIAAELATQPFSETDN